MEWTVVYRNSKGLDVITFFKPKTQEESDINGERSRAYDFYYYLRQHGYNAVIA